MDGSGPWVPDFDDNSPWRWPWWKFDMKPEDLFTTLTDRYNTVPYKTQNYEAFHQDVNEIAAKAEDVLDFHQRRALRREQRIQEMRRAWDNIGVNVLCNSSVFDDNAARLKAFLYFTSNLSLDALILFVDSLHPRPLRDTTQANVQLPRPDTAPTIPTGTTPCASSQGNMAGSIDMDASAPDRGHEKQRRRGGLEKR